MEIKRESVLEVYEDQESMSPQIVDLIDHAKRAMSRAYAPYSQFKVGAALLTDNGRIIEGNNQENAAYPSGLCAERVALFHAGSQYPGELIRALAITVNAEGELQPLEDLVSPCGACLQVISETENRQESAIDIYIATRHHVYHAKGVAHFLPFQFNTKL